MRRRNRTLAAALIALACAQPAAAQQQPGPPPPLGTPPVPAGNPQTPAKIALGKALFWDEQLSRTGTVACGTCHQPNGGGGDPRSVALDLSSTNPGPNALFGDADDVQGSAGVPLHQADGAYASSASFGLLAQVGGRNAPSAINAGFSQTLFWDGRAGGTLLDPDSGQTLIADGAALENQALGPVVNTAEMAHTGATLADVALRVQQAPPLQLAAAVPAALDAWIAGRSYPALFAEVFGDPAVTPARIALAIASYERSLVSNLTPFDTENGGTPALTPLERQGRQVFVQNDCAACHAGALTSDNEFHYIGVRPVADDLGRFAQTNVQRDRGAMRTPSLRNVELSAPYMHNGRFATLEDVVDFYDRGGDFDAPNKDNRIRPLNLTPQQRTALLAFLRRPLTDPRVAAETAPFDRPTLYSESTRVPTVDGAGRAGSGGGAPRMIAVEPPLAGSDNFTLGIAGGLGGATATLVVDIVDPGVGTSVPDPGVFAPVVVTLGGSGAGAGYGSAQLTLPSNIGDTTLYARWYVADPQAANGIAVSPLATFTLFGGSATVMRDGFED